MIDFDQAHIIARQLSGRNSYCTKLQETNRITMATIEKAAGTELATKMGGMVPLLAPRISYNYDELSILDVSYDEKGTIELSSTDLSLNSEDNERYLYKYDFFDDAKALSRSRKTVHDDDQLLKVDIKRGGNFGKTEEFDWTVKLTMVQTKSVDVDSVATSTSKKSSQWLLGAPAAGSSNAI